MEGKVEELKAEAKKGFEDIKKLLNDESGWTPFDHKIPDVKAKKRSLEGKSIDLISATGLVKGVEPQELFSRIWDQSSEEKKKNDETLLEEEILESGDDVKVVYQCYHAPWPLSNRDLVLLRSKWVEGDTIYQVDRSTKHEKKPDPTGSNVRADLIGCYKYEKVEHGTLATYAVLMDPCGNIPAFVVNSNMSKCPARIAEFRTMQ